MLSGQATWRRTGVIIGVLAVVVVAPYVVARASHDNWNLTDVTRRMPWHDPADGLAGPITTDAAAASSCAAAPTFGVEEADEGALFWVDGPLTLEEANDRLASLDIALAVGLIASDPSVVDGSVVRLSAAGGDEPMALAAAVEAGVDEIDQRIPVLLPSGSSPVGLTLACAAAPSP